jgi:hypothetical protein
MENKRTQWYIGAPNGVVLCINGYRDHEFQGILYHSYSTEGIPFENVEQMTVRMEKLYDWLQFPHPTTINRSFAPVKRAGRVINERKKIMSDESLLSKHGDMGSFIIRVQHRQNSSWQGRITWMEQDKTVYFRSIWEMIKLIESAVDTVSDPDSEDKEASWFQTDNG